MYFETETKIREDEKICSNNGRGKLYQRMASKLNTAHYCYYYTPVVCIITFCLLFLPS